MFFNPRANWVGSLLLLAAAQWLWGCSTAGHVSHSGRRGLLDIEEAHDASGSGRWIAQLPPQEELPMEAGATIASTDGFRWPLSHITITSEFGKRRGGEFHEGMDLRAAPGTPVLAAHAGRVIYAGNKIRGYGKLVVIKDRQGYSTVYAHNSKLLVIAGQVVKAGQRVALSGSTGSSRGPHVHFEIRKGVAAQNPRSFLEGKPALAEVKVGTQPPATVRSVATSSPRRRHRMRPVARVAATARPIASGLDSSPNAQTEEWEQTLQRMRARESRSRSN